MENHRNKKYHTVRTVPKRKIIETRNTTPSEQFLKENHRNKKYHTIRTVPKGKS